MKLQTHRNLKDNIPAEKVSHYRLDDSAVVHITRILRNMYEDPVKAVVREYLANAIDAHNQINQTLPIEVHIPTSLNPVFKCRDFGPGLKIDHVETYLFGFGSSGEHKRSSNKQIGGFGIGCKCGFAISDSFTYISWHNGMKQTWLCYLDNTDMGQAKLISHTPSDEPTGIQIEIPVAQHQVYMFDRHSKEVPIFFSQPLKINGVLKDPTKSKKIITQGVLSGELNRTSWEIFNIDKDSDFGSVEIKDRIIVQMGDLWYPVDTSQIYNNENKSKTSKLMRVLNNGNYYSSNTGKICAIKAPIGSFSLAPTRENLQYDGLTRKALQLIVNEIDNTFQESAQKEVDSIDNIWEASDKALKLKDNVLYNLSEELVNKKPKPGFKWKNKNIFFDKAFSIPAESDTTGAKIFLGVRDLKGLHTRVRYNKSPSAGQLKTSVRLINENDQYLPVNHRSIYRDTTLDLVKEDGLNSKLTEALFYTEKNENDVKYPIIGIFSEINISYPSKHKIDQYILPSVLPVYTMNNEYSGEYQLRRFLNASNSTYAPTREAYAVLIQGDEESINNVFQKYPWLKHNVKPLPIIKTDKIYSSGTTNKKSRTLKTLENTYTYKRNNFKVPSENWIPIEEKVNNKKCYYVHLDKFLPSDKPPGAKTLNAQNQFKLLETAIDITEWFLGEEIVVYGFRHVKNSKAEVPKNAVFLFDFIDDKLKHWMDPSNIEKYDVHGLHLLTYGCASSYSIIAKLSLDDIENVKQKSKLSTLEWNNWSRSLHVDLLDTIKKYGDKLLKGINNEKSYFKDLILSYLESMGFKQGNSCKLRTEKILNGIDLLYKFKDACSYSYLSSKSKIFNFRDNYNDTLKQHLKPIESKLETFWDKYPMFNFSSHLIIGEKFKEDILAKEMINYINLIDSQKEYK